MRVLVVVVILVSLARVGSAAPARTCYAGTRVDTMAGTDTRASVVLVRVVDRAAKQIATTTWTDRDPDRGITHTAVVDADHGTFTAEDEHLHTQTAGTLGGKAWRWTAVHAKTSLPDRGLAWQSDVQLSADGLVMTTSSQRDGTVEATSRLEASAFDCKQLDARRAALDPTSPGAVHTCYEGTSTTVGGPGEGKRPVVIDQVVDAKARTIELRRWSQGVGALHRVVLAIDGATITVTGSGPADAGSIGRKPGAWTDYTWTLHLEMLVSTIHGTLGGPTLTETAVTRYGTKEVSHTDLAASAFDCAKLAERRAAVAALVRAP